MTEQTQLEHAAADGSLDLEKWTTVLQDVLTRLEHIVYNEFPMPVPIPVETQPPTVPNSEEEPSSTQGSDIVDKENAPPTQSGPTGEDAPADTRALPSELHNLYLSIRRTLTSSFSKFPPHTVQRVAELILAPRAHYRYLPSYLRALDRVVCVSSNTTVFPLPQASLPNTSGTLLNGATNASSTAAALGSDESLGGALLTPIPWLKTDDGIGSGSISPRAELKSESTEIVDGPNGAGRIETVSVVNGVLVTGNGCHGNGNGNGNGNRNGNGGASTTEHDLRAAGGVTQGELLRQEQEAGVVPSNAAYVPAAGSPPVAEGGEEWRERERESKSPEEPHARGPEEIGMEDTGPQESRDHGLDLEAAVGRRVRASSHEPDAHEKMEETATEEGDKDRGGSDESMKDASD